MFTLAHFSYDNLAVNGLIILLWNYNIICFLPRGAIIIATTIIPNEIITV
jgi:hypothetical protein